MPGSSPLSMDLPMTGPLTSFGRFLRDKFLDLLSKIGILFPPHLLPSYAALVLFTILHSSCLCNPLNKKSAWLCWLSKWDSLSIQWFPVVYSVVILFWEHVHEIMWEEYYALEVNTREAALDIFPGQLLLLVSLRQRVIVGIGNTSGRLGVHPLEGQFGHQNLNRRAKFKGNTALVPEGHVPAFLFLNLSLETFLTSIKKAVDSLKL